MKLKLLLLPLLLALTLGSWFVVDSYQPAVTAQRVDLDAILAEATVKGLLNGLKYSTTSRLNIIQFYLTEELAQSSFVQSLDSQQVTGYQILGSEKQADGQYLVRAQLEPSGRILVAEVAQAEVRWRITNLSWGSASDTSNSSTTTSGNTSTDNTTTNNTDNSTTGNDNNNTNTSTETNTPSTGDGPIGEVLSPQLNVRQGPGENYAVVKLLDKGDKVEIVGVSGQGTWYQIAQNGQIIGWVSSWREFLATTARPDVPFVPAPATTGSNSNSNSSTNNTSPGNVAVNTGSSGGSKLILQTHSGGDFYLVENNGSTVRRLSSGIDPALSPDGNRIAFTRWGPGEVGQLLLYDLNNNQESVILGEMLEPKAPTWSPDGSKIIINFQHGGRRDIESKCYSLDDGGSPPRNAYDIKFNNGKLCFKIPPDTFWQLRQVDVATGNFDDLPSATYSYAPTWDPANPWRVVFAASTGLLQLDLNRGEYFAFTSDLRDHAPVFSPDGSKVAVSYRQHQHWEVYTIDTANAQRTRLTTQSVLADSQYNNAAPAWSPDSQQIAFVTDRNGDWEFWVMNADGSNQRPLLSPEVAAQISVEYHGVDERLINWGQ